MSRVRVAVVTLVRGHALHLKRQKEAVDHLDPRPSAHVVVSLDDAPCDVSGATVLHRPVRPAEPLLLAGARNAAIAAATASGAELVLCLDAHCVPEPTMLGRLADAARATGGARLLAGPVGRLPALEADRLAPRPKELTESREAARRGPRPVPEENGLLDEPRAELFCSLAFAVTPATHARIGCFDEAYVGFGAEDTDYAFRARRAGVGLTWVGGAWALTSTTPKAVLPTSTSKPSCATPGRFAAAGGGGPWRAGLQPSPATG